MLFMKVVDTTTGAMGNDMTEGVATGVTGATADTEVVAAVVAAADTLVATEILGKGGSLPLGYVCCALNILK